jgi:3-phosphoshikimate 1-carboxyvinyltransferase
MPAEIAIIPVMSRLDGEITLPGSKSITNRAMLLAAIARGRSRIQGALFSDDTARMASALQSLGFDLCVDQSERRIEITGTGGPIPAPHASLDSGNAGTAMRFLAGFVTLGRGRYRLDGSARMRERPLGSLLDAMRQLGVNAISEDNNDCPPIAIDTSGSDFAGGAVTLDASLSSQFASALLMPAPLWRDGLRLQIIGETARPFIEMTLKLMNHWGAHSSIAGNLVVVPGGQAYRAQEFDVEPDATAASYFAAAAATTGGSITINGLTKDSVQGDLGFLAILERMGARITWRNDGVTVSGTGEMRGVDIAMNDMPDVVPTLAAIAPLASSPTRIRGVAFIRHHESDRIRALATELRRLGAAVEEFDDGLGIAPSKLHGATLETYDDHRIAMAFAITGLTAAGIRLKNPACVAKTYPDFFRDLALLSGRDSGIS